VFKDEMRRQPGAQAALRKEWYRLRAINTWLEDEVEEWGDVEARAERQGVEIHMGMVFQICVEEDSEKEREEWLRTWKGRGVFRGDDVVGENWDVAMFQELGSAPATMVAAKFCDLRGLLRGHINENVDTTQARTQSLLGGTKTWVSLPRDEWPESWKHMRRPVCPLVEALYGHPDARGYWEQRCDNHLKDCGFGPVAPADRAWRSCYFSPSLQCYVIVYVDDFEISSPRAGVEEAWGLIRGENPRAKERGIVLDEPTPSGKFLGCNRECSYVRAPPMRSDTQLVLPFEGVRHSESAVGAHYTAVVPGAGVNTHDDPVGGVFDPTAGNVCCEKMKYDVSDFLGSCVRLCQELTNATGVPLKPARAPFIEEAGDDYRLGAGVCEESQDAQGKDAHVDIERTLQELAQIACCGEERNGYFTHGCDFDDVADCHASMCGNLTGRRIPYSEDMKEGSVPKEFVRARQMGNLCVGSRSGANAPTMTEVHRSGPTLRSVGQVEIDLGRSVVATAGLRLLSFRGQEIRMAQSVLGPGNRGEMRVRTSLCTPEDHGAMIVIEVANFGCVPYVILQNSCVGQIAITSVDEIVCAIANEKHAEVCLAAPDCEVYAETMTDVVIVLGHHYNAKKYRKPWVGHQSAGGPEITKMCDPDVPIPEPTGILQPIASRILMKIPYAVRMCRYDLLRAVCGLASCTTKWAHQCDSDLHRLICYINTTRHRCVIGWRGGPDAILDQRIYADADFAGCVRTLRSATGVALAVEGPNTRMVANGVFERQTAVSHSTPEAEIVAADYAMRQEGMPALSLLECILERPVRLCVMEDNEAMIRICRSGKNPQCAISIAVVKWALLG
jgi:hypothetical protein